MSAQQLDAERSVQDDIWFEFFFRVMSEQLDLLSGSIPEVLGSQGQVHARLYGAPSAGQSHSGNAVSEKVANCLEEHPAGLSSAVCRQRLRSIGGDGAVCS